MTYRASTKAIPLRADGAEGNAPGLYPGETLIELDAGDLVAVSISARRLTNGGGMSFKAWARPIAPDGRTLADVDGEELEVDHVHAVDPGTLAAIGEQAIMRELLLLMLGEEPTMRDVPVDDGEEPCRAPLIAWSDQVRANVSVREHLRQARLATPEADAGALLFDN